MNLNDFSKWLQHNRVNNVRGSEYFRYPLCVCIYIYIYMNSALHNYWDSNDKIASFAVWSTDL